MTRLLIVLLLTCLPGFADQHLIDRTKPAPLGGYLLGPGDEISVRVLDSVDIPDKPVRIDPDGQIALPLIGRIKAAGKPVKELEQDVTIQLRKFIIDPQVSINVTEFGSQPVSVLGAVMAPGVYQLGGPKPLLQVIALAKGLAPEAGGMIRIASYRSSAAGVLSKSDLEHPVVTEVSVEDLLASSEKASDIEVRPHDVITVPKARLVYVIGEVHKPGGHFMNDHGPTGVLDALSMAEGLLPTASSQHARLLRKTEPSGQRTDIPVDLKALLAGKAEDMALQPDDILLVPNNAARSVGLKTLETAIQLGTGIVIWRR